MERETVDHETIKVIGAGWGRTGTLSLKKALEILGYSPTYHFFEFLQYPSHVNLWFRIIDKEVSNFDDIYIGEKVFSATCDIPACLFWKEQLRRYPHAKVILTVRESESWYQSASETILKGVYGSPNQYFGIKIVDWIGLNPIPKKFWIRLFDQKLFHGDWSKKNIISSYERHIQEVREECPPGQLLEFDIREGWKPLCEFLGKSVPREPFPHLNDFTKLKSMLHMVNIFGYLIVILVSIVPMLLGIYFVKS